MRYCKCDGFVHYLEKSTVSPNDCIDIARMTILYRTTVQYNVLYVQYASDDVENRIVNF